MGIAADLPEEHFAAVEAAYALESLWAEQAALRLQSTRRRHGVSGGQLAQLTGLSKSTISRFENCEREPTMSQKALIALALGVDVHTIWPSPTYVELLNIIPKRVAA